MVNMIIIMNVLVQHSLYSKLDRLLQFHTYDELADSGTMLQVLRLRFQCDADLGDNQDNGHSQTAMCGRHMQAGSM